MPDTALLVRSETMRSRGRAGLTGASSVATDEGGATALTASAGFRFETGVSNSMAPPVSRLSSFSSNRRMTPYSPS